MLKFNLVNSNCNVFVAEKNNFRIRRRRKYKIRSNCIYYKLRVLKDYKLILTKLSRTQVIIERPWF